MTQVEQALMTLEEAAQIMGRAVRRSKELGEENKKLLEALEKCETEMRYAGWGDLDEENVGRSQAYWMAGRVISETNMKAELLTIQEKQSWK